MIIVILISFDNLKNDDYCMHSDIWIRLCGDELGQSVEDYGKNKFSSNKTIKRIEGLLLDEYKFSYLFIINYFIIVLI